MSWWHPKHAYGAVGSRSIAQQEIHAVKEIVDLLIDGSPHGHLLDIAEFSEHLPSGVRASVRRYLPAMLVVMHQWGLDGRISLPFVKNEDGSYDRSRVVVLVGPVRHAAGVGL